MSKPTMEWDVLATEVNKNIQRNLPVLIGIAGLKTSGKDTVADYWEQQYGIKKMGMSDTLHAVAMAANPWVGHSVAITGGVLTISPITYRAATESHGYAAAKEAFPEYREFLQRMGDQAGRAILGESIWAEDARARILKELEAGQPVVVTGVRKANEIQMIRELGGVMIYVERPGLTPDGHSSEGQITPAQCEFYIDNGGDLKELYTHAEWAWDEIAAHRRSEGA